MVTSVQDVYPQSLIAQGRLADASWLARLMRRIDQFVTRRCSAVIVISQSFADTYRADRGLRPIGFTLFPTGLRLNQLYRMIPAQAQVQTQHGIIDEGLSSPMAETSAWRLA